MKKIRSVFILFVVMVVCNQEMKHIDTVSEENTQVINELAGRFDFLAQYYNFLKKILKEVLSLHIQIISEIKLFCYYFIVNVHTLIFSAFFIYLYHSFVSKIISNRCGYISLCKTQKYSEVEKKEESCSICINQFESDDIVRVLPCDHVYHSKCIYNWVRKSLACPLCRKSIIDGYTNDHEVLIFF